ncbi:MAG: LCP family protein [Eubacterium sp.]|nr:LCP family protein [Eubacterium sp.]
MGLLDDEDEDEFTYADYDKEEKKQKKKKESMTKWIVALLLELIALVVVITAIIQLKLKIAWGNINFRELSGEDLMISEKANPDMANYTNIAFFGIDARDDSLGSGSNSDSMMIISINNSTKEVKVVSLYRDTLLRIPGQSINAKANSAFNYGGPVLGIQMINQNLDLNVSEYLTVNWEAMTRAVDILGGVTVNVNAEELEKMNEYIAEQISSNGLVSNGVSETGDVTLNGVQATAYARVRSTDQGDITRTMRQREVLEAMVGKLKKADMSTIDKLIEGTFPYMETSLSEDDFITLVKAVKDYKFVSAVGFPFEFEYCQDESRGSSLAPKNLVQNVVALHNYLFGTVAYEPTDAVKENDSKISKETGVGDNGPVIVHPEIIEE